MAPKNQKKHQGSHHAGAHHPKEKAKSSAVSHSKSLKHKANTEPKKESKKPAKSGALKQVAKDLGKKPKHETSKNLASSAINKKKNSTNAPAKDKASRTENKLAAHEPSLSGKGKSKTEGKSMNLVSTTNPEAQSIPLSLLNKGKPAKAPGKVRSSGSSLGRKSSENLGEVCREVACEGLATTGGYCRMHYIKNWKKIKRKEVILKEKKLNHYIEELVSKYPDKYIEAIRLDLASDKEFAKVIYDLDLDEAIDEFDADAEGDENVIDNIRRDFEDDSEGF